MYCPFKFTVFRILAYYQREIQETLPHANKTNALGGMNASACALRQ